MTNTGNKTHNISIKSANRSPMDKPYVFFYNDEIMVNANEGVNINITSFSLLNSMYNVNKHTQNNKLLSNTESKTIPYGNYNVHTL